MSTVQMLRMRQLIRMCIVAAPFSLIAADTLYRAVSLDSNGQLRITSDDGKYILPAKVEDQVSFGSLALSPDHRTIGWLVGFADPMLPTGDPLSGALVLYRNGRVVFTFNTEQVFWDWQFQEGGKQVAYSTGPTHGGAAECFLVNAFSGKLIAKWSVKDHGKPPAWAKVLRRE